ncbi:ROK family protein [Streptomyces sp. NBC_00842]
MDAALSLLTKVTRTHRLELEGLVAAGLGLSGHHPDPGAGGQSADETVVGDLVERLKAALDLPVTWDHNIRLAAVAERGAVELPACADLVYVALSHGVGSGIVVNGTLARGASGTPDGACTSSPRTPAPSPGSCCAGSTCTTCTESSTALGRRTASSATPLAASSSRPPGRPYPPRSPVCAFSTTRSGVLTVKASMPGRTGATASNSATSGQGCARHRGTPPPA